MTTKRKLAAPALPSSHLEAIDAAGFEVLRWQNKSVRTVCSDGTERNEWLPEDLVHWEKRLFIRWACDDKYDFAGWEPQTGGQFGGRYRDVQGALSWFAWLEAQR